MAQATIDLGLNTASFTAGLNEAERKSQSFEGRVAGLFRRSPLQRAERAFSELAVNLATGNVAQGIAAFATKISGLGLVAGVAVGAAVGLFQRFRSEILITDKAAQALGADLATLGGTRGPGEVAAKFKEIKTETDNLIAASKSAGNEFANFLDKYVNPVLGTTSRGRGKAQKSEIEAGFSAQGKLLTDQAKAEERITAIKIERLRVGEREAQIDAILYDAASKRTQIDEKATKLKLDLFAANVNPKLRDKLISDSQIAAERQKKAINDAAGAEIDATNRIAELKNKQFDIEKNISAQALLGVSAEDQKISRLKQQLALIQEQLKARETLPAERRKELETSVTKTKAQLDEALKARGVVVPKAVEGSTPAGIYDPNLGGYRTVMRPQEEANLRNYQAEAKDRLRGDYADYNAKMREYQANVADYLRGADYYSPEQLKHPNQPGGYSIDPFSGQLHGYDIDWKTGQYIPKSPGGKQGQGQTSLTKEEFQSAMDAVMEKYWGD